MSPAVPPHPCLFLCGFHAVEFKFKAGEFDSIQFDSYSIQFHSIPIQFNPNSNSIQFKFKFNSIQIQFKFNLIAGPCRPRNPTDIQGGKRGRNRFLYRLPRQKTTCGGLYKRGGGCFRSAAGMWGLVVCLEAWCFPPPRGIFREFFLVFSSCENCVYFGLAPSRN